MIEYLKNISGTINYDALLEAKQNQDEIYKRKGVEHFPEVLEKLPEVADSFLEIRSDVAVIESQTIDKETKETIIELAKELIPWRKGPFGLFGEDLDAEWRSDHKWQRVKPHLPPLKNKTVLDIGCNNGYFMFQMAKENPRLALGIDPMPIYQTQFRFMNHYAKCPNLQFELWGIEHLHHFENVFDVIFSMGIIYHHRHPIEQLQHIKQALKPGGQVILETIGIPGEESYALFPEDRYAKMRNVWFIPTLSCLINWTQKAKLIDIEVISSTPLTPKEQRNTKWCPPPYQSLEDFLDPNDPSKTVEGHPAPMRFAIKAKKRRR